MKGLYEFFSYLSVFILGMYVYGSLNGHSPKLYQIVLTTGFGLYFYMLSLKDEDNSKKG